MVFRKETAPPARAEVAEVTAVVEARNAERVSEAQATGPRVMTPGGKPLCGAVHPTEPTVKCLQIVDERGKHSGLHFDTKSKRRWIQEE